MSDGLLKRVKTFGHSVVLVRVITKIDTNVVTAQANIRTGGWGLFLTKLISISV